MFVDSENCHCRGQGRYRQYDNLRSDQRLGRSGPVSTPLNVIKNNWPTFSSGVKETNCVSAVSEGDSEN